MDHGNIIKSLKIDDIIQSARENVLPKYAKCPWKHPELKHGTAILHSNEELNSYMAAYGDAHKEKAFKAIEFLPLGEIKGPFEICDWGCGQGIATICLLEKLIARNLLSNLQTIHLVEPGQAALKRAEFNIKRINPELKIECINKGLPSANVPFECISEITFEQPVVIHLFSNILDIEAINLKMVANLVAASGSRHYVVCMGPANRNEDRINAFCRYFDEKYVNFLNSFRESQFYRNNFYNGHVFGCFIKIFRFDTSKPVLIPYEFYAPKQFFAAYESDINQIPLDKLDCAFDVLAPFDIGGSVYDDPHPLLAVLNNIIVRGLPTKLSPWIEALIAQEFEVSKKEVFLGTIRFKLVNENLNEEKANLIKLVPIGVARIQKVIIEALLTGKLLFSKNWRVLVNENDVPCAAMAIKELSDMYNHLASASRDYDNLAFPEIDLTIINHKYPDSKLHLDAKVFLKSDMAIAEVEYDLVIDISSTELSQPQSVKFSEFRVKNNCYFNIRNSSAVYDERYVYTTNRIVYKPLTNILPQGTHEIIEENVGHLRYFLQLIFRKEDFRPGQLPIISRALQLKSVIGLLPTGAGKSLTYQIAAFLQPGISIVVDPLISLMKDQYDGLLKCSIDIATFINSSVSNKAQRESEMKESKYLFVFLSPERLTIEEFRKTLKAMRDTKVYFSYGVIDEVHCVSEWGHDFRFSYLHLGRNLYSYVLPRQTRNEELDHITLIGLTATASFDVLADVERELSGNSAFPLDAQSTVRYENTNRLELQYRIVKIKEPKYRSSMWDIYEAKNKRAPHILQDIVYESMRDLSAPHSIQRIKKRFIERENIESNSAYAREISEANIAVDIKKNWYEGGDASAIVFCPHRSGYLGVNDNTKGPGIATSIGSSLGIDTISTFCGGDTLVSQDEFINGKSNLMVATKAFGMGIDKPNVRFTLNVNHSGSLEAYVQEAGRAGRDRKMALSVIMYSDCNVLDKSTGKYQPVDYGVHKFFYDGNFIGPEFEKMIMYYLMAYHPITVVDEYNQHSTFSQGFIPPVKAASPGETVVSLISFQYPSNSSDELDLLLNKAGMPPSGGTSNKIEQRREKYFECLMKAIYRMCCIGLIEDFTVDYRSKKFMITSVCLEEGGYYNNLKTFLLRYFSENRVNLEIEKAKAYRGQDEIQKCLGYLIDFVYKSIAVKRKQAINDIELFCKRAVESSANWLEVNEDLKDDLYFYFNSKYARRGFFAPNGESFSLVDDTVEGKEFNPDHIFKYMRVINDDIVDTGTPNDNVRHLLGAVRLVRRALTDTNPTLDFLNVFCILYLKPDQSNRSLNEELKKSYLDGYLDFRTRSDDLNIFYSHVNDFKDRLKTLHIATEEQVSEFNDLEVMAEVSFHSEWLTSFAKNFNR